MRILTLNWKDPGQPDSGGAEIYVRRIAEIWAADGHNVTLFVPRPRLSAEHEVVRGVTYLRRGSRTTVFREARKHLRDRGREYDAVLESISTRPFMAHEIVGPRAVSLYHQMARDVWTQEFRFPVSWLGQHLVEPSWVRRMRGARIVAVSPSTAADLLKHGVSTVRVVPPASDVPAASAPRTLSQPPRLLYVGRLVRSKRPQDAVAAFEHVRRQHPGATLDVIGAGYLHRALAEQHAPGVIVHGYVDAQRKAQLMGRAHLMLLPGTREGWGIVALEAMCCGLPVVAYDVPGLRDAIVHEETGLLTASDARLLGQAACSLLADGRRWAAMSAAGLARARSFSWDRTAADVLAVMTNPAARADRAGARQMAHWS